MTFLLPEEGCSLEDLRSSLDPEFWREIVSYKRERVVDVMIPSFESEYGTENLNAILQKMGIVSAFDPSKSDYSEMTDDNGVFIKAVYHKAKLTVDETGSKAAAVTDVYLAMATSNGASVPPTPAPEVKFHAEKPFIYIISEVSTGAILFIGQYTGKE